MHRSKAPGSFWLPPFFPPLLIFSYHWGEVPVTTDTCPQNAFFLILGCLFTYHHWWTFIKVSIYIIKVFFSFDIDWTTSMHVLSIHLMIYVWFQKSFCFFFIFSFFLSSIFCFVIMANYCGEAFSGLMTDIHRSQNKISGGLSMDHFFVRLQRMLERKSRLFWNKWYFMKYMDDKITPWGLRIQILPTISNVDQEFKTEWETNLQICSFKMMTLLCQRYTLDLDSLDRE